MNQAIAVAAGAADAAAKVVLCVGCSYLWKYMSEKKERGRERA
jgi:energy-converting hydrogenase Eha subunit C